MRKYRSGRELQRLHNRHRDSRSAAPFPGPNPLRLAWKIVAIDPLTLKQTVLSTYEGKFTQSAWTYYCRQYEKVKNTPSLSANYRLYDRGKIVMGGPFPGNINLFDSRIGHRYFYGSDSWPFLEALNLRRVVPIRIGTYWLYDVGFSEVTPTRTASILRALNTTVPHIRSIA